MDKIGEEMQKMKLNKKTGIIRTGNVFYVF